jgi:heptaprenylglyceryl phosphate synthase
MWLENAWIQTTTFTENQAQLQSDSNADAIMLQTSYNTYLFTWVQKFHIVWREIWKKDGVNWPTRSLTFQTVNRYIIVANDSGSCGNLTRIHVLLLEIQFAQFFNLKIGHCIYNCTRLLNCLL